MEKNKRQLLVFATFVPDPPEKRRPSGGLFASIDVKERPKRVWTLMGHQDPASPPALPFRPAHLANAFHEDPGHDWMWQNGKLRYFSHAMDRSCWLLLEY